MGRMSLEVAYRGGTVHAVYAPADRGYGPLIVALHGGTYTWDYFDVGEDSLLAMANANGVSVLAIDRPNYGRSSPLSLELGGAFRANAAAISEALSVFWAEHGHAYDGVVLVGHSIGGMVSIHLAATEHDWPLLGVCSDGFGSQIAPQPQYEDPQPAPGGTVSFPPEVRRAAMYGPDGTFDPQMLGLATTAPAPFEEIDNAYEPWAQELPVLGPRITVPLCLSSAEHEHLWIVTPETVAVLRAAFPNAPWIETLVIPGTGHNIDHHLVGRGFNLRRISFALISAALNRLGRGLAVERT